MLRESGAKVTVVEAYQTVIGRGGDDIPALLAAGRIDAITFTSSSTARNFVKRLETEGGRLEQLAGVCLAAIGPVTAETMRTIGLSVDLMPETFTVSALINALNRYYE